MSNEDKWWNQSWSVVTGCTPVSDACDHCYARRMAQRFPAKFGGVENPFRVTLHEKLLEAPWSWIKPREVFVCSTSDLFHEEVPFEYISKVFAMMHNTKRHRFYVLTKRPGRMAEFCRWYQCVWLKGFERAWPKEYLHVWLGTTIEDQKYRDERLNYLFQCGAANYFVSVEPMLSNINLSKWLTCQGCGTRTRKHLPAKAIDCCPESTSMLDWVICGGESGPHARPMHPDWARSLRDQCQAAGVSFYFKQWGEWVEAENKNIPPKSILDRNKKSVWVEQNGSHSKDATEGWEDIGSRLMVNVGKKTAGRKLDGREWLMKPEKMGI